jgi:WD40 repeat protein
MTLATGNQDKTTRIYDVRNLSQSLHVLGANVGAIRSLHYSNDGKWLAMAGKGRREKGGPITWSRLTLHLLCLMSVIESIDFVHLFDTSTDYEACQVIDFFGDIAGVGKNIRGEKKMASSTFFFFFFLTEMLATVVVLVAFTPDTQGLMIANSDESVG